MARALARQAAVASHTGALAGDYAVMRTMVESAGIAMVDSLEELVDVGQLLLRFRPPANDGLGIVDRIRRAMCDRAGFRRGSCLRIPPLSGDQDIEALS